MREWAKKYHDHGLSVIGVHTPEFGFERDVENMMAATSCPPLSPFRGRASYPLRQSGLKALPVRENGELVGMLTVEDVGQPTRAATEEDWRYCYDGRERLRRKESFL